MRRILLAGLILIDLPGHQVRLCDGGMVKGFGADFTARDALFGSVSGFEALSEGVGDEIPGGMLTFLPPAGVKSSDLIKGSYQNARLAMWIAEVNERTGRVVGTPDLQIEAQVDVCRMRFGKQQRLLEVEFTARAERLFLIDEGNTLSPQFHQSVWPGETGLDQATGLTIEQAWGAKSPLRGVVGGGSTAGFGGGAGGRAGGGMVAYV